MLAQGAMLHWFLKDSREEKGKNRRTACNRRAYRFLKTRSSSLRPPCALLFCRVGAAIAVREAAALESRLRVRVRATVAMILNTSLRMTEHFPN